MSSPLVSHSRHLSIKTDEALPSSQEEQPTVEDKSEETSPTLLTPIPPQEDPAIRTPLPLFPDGGTTAWLQVAMGFLLMFSSWGLVNAFGIFQAYYTSLPSFSKAGSSIPWIGSVQTCLTLLPGPIAGRAVDAGHARLITILGSMLIVTSYIGISLSGNNATLQPSGSPALVYWQLMLTQGILNGLGMGLVFMPSIAVPATYFRRRRALALGIATAGAPLGGIVYPLAFESLLATVGFRWATRVLALLALVTLGTACLLISPRTDLPRRGGALKSRLLDLGAFRDVPFALLVLGTACSFVGLYVPFYFVLSRIRDAGVDLHGLPAYTTIVFLNVGGFFGRLVPNFIADRTSPILTHTLFVLLSGLLILAWPFALSLASIVAFTIIFGFCSGPFTSMPPASVASITPDMSRYGARFGTAVVCNAVGVLIGPPIAGAIIERGRGRGGGNAKGYLGAAVFASVVVVVGSGALGAAGWVHRKRGRRRGEGDV